MIISFHQPHYSARFSAPWHPIMSAPIPEPILLNSCLQFCVFSPRIFNSMIVVGEAPFHIGSLDISTLLHLFCMFLCRSGEEATDRVSLIDRLVVPLDMEF